MGTEGPEALSEILSRLFTQRGWGREQSQLRLEEAWRMAAGVETAQETRCLTGKRGIIEILVRNGVLLQELSSFRKRELLAAMQGRLGSAQVKDLRFRLES